MNGRDSKADALLVAQHPNDNKALKLWTTTWMGVRMDEWHTDGGLTRFGGFLLLRGGEGGVD